MVELVKSGFGFAVARTLGRAVYFCDLVVARWIASGRGEDGAGAAWAGYDPGSLSGYWGMGVGVAS